MNLIDSFLIEDAYLAYLAIAQVVADTRPIDRLRKMGAQCGDWVQKVIHQHCNKYLTNPHPFKLLTLRTLYLFFIKRRGASLCTIRQPIPTSKTKIGGGAYPSLYTRVALGYKE